jgi:hypothetical protein
MGPGSRVGSEDGARHRRGQADIDVTSAVLALCPNISCRAWALILRVLKQTCWNSCRPLQHHFAGGSVDSFSLPETIHIAAGTVRRRLDRVKSLYPRRTFSQLGQGTDVTPTHTVTAVRSRPGRSTHWCSRFIHYYSSWALPLKRTPLTCNASLITGCRLAVQYPNGNMGHGYA